MPKCQLNVAAAKRPNEMRILTATILMIMSVQCINATAQHMPLQNPLKYFAGNWKGAGKFANGKDIEAELTFTYELDSNYLVGRHRDRAPNKFQADTYWRFEQATGKLTSVLLGNSGPERIFSEDIVYADSIVFSRVFEAVGKGNVTEQFIYKIQDHSQFRMEYRVRVGNKPWRMIDYLIFRR